MYDDRFHVSDETLLFHKQSGHRPTMCMTFVGERGIANLSVCTNNSKVN